jgi:expansin (peptidoglycan-binding protein)
MPNAAITNAKIAIATATDCAPVSAKWKWSSYNGRAAGGVFAGSDFGCATLGCVGDAIGGTALGDVYVVLVAGAMASVGAAAGAVSVSSSDCMAAAASAAGSLSSNIFASSASSASSRIRVVRSEADTFCQGDVINIVRVHTHDPAADIVDRDWICTGDDRIHFDAIGNLEI